MKKFLLPLVALAFATPAAAQSIVVTGSDEEGLAPLSVAYEELKAGQNALAVDKLTHSDIDPQDPSRLINLGTAYARLGKTADAQTAYKAAITSDIRYDVELANGTYMDSRWAARTALSHLNQGKPLLALAR
ncbi:MULTISPECIES: hypothetical protein [unclassified Sphingopyxis]|jgi:Flp pilus assembly protein TadD|uniref:hypothetical protein n=1 Tax=unclassified Sphingopyxis TaxID=2614943 RepID=UPI000730723C|nr:MULTISPECIES: hypothetical protein [unclassified Sphingopyxis]KTE25869.1 hypothetical protein ATE61_09095 [Sphingopyxis sp. H057]KTE51550.1 hypothetical protein ATE64_13515 [Sphingopyxis sp. H073]KTE53948.1 hypothetical protein ATE69_10960 [Sphingopyxis sp. H071]KTE58950.1 hypothetical protein ATE66_13365 [Sphingopyxis sp. H107]KTE65572.1 hypothetical protein ATE65_08485 [Sphingopyxis sp. H100]